MNLIEQLLAEGRKEELLELFQTMQEEMRQLNSDKEKLQAELRMCQNKAKFYRKRFNQLLSGEGPI